MRFKALRGSPKESPKRTISASGGPGPLQVELIWNQSKEKYETDYLNDQDQE